MTGEETWWAGWGERGCFYCIEELKEGNDRLSTWHYQFKAQRARSIPEGFTAYGHRLMESTDQAEFRRVLTTRLPGHRCGRLRTVSGGQWKSESWTGNFWKDSSNSEYTNAKVPLSLPHWQKPVSNSQGSSLKGDDNSHALLLLPSITSWPKIRSLLAPGMQRTKELSSN